MKRLLTLLFILSTLNVFAQNADVMKMMGVEPRVPEATGCKYIPYKVDSTIYLVSYNAILSFNNRVTPQPLTNFTIHGDTIRTSLPKKDAKSTFRILGVIDQTSDTDGSYTRLQCVDNAGGMVAVALSFQLDTCIAIIYRNSTYLYTVKLGQIPQDSVYIGDEEPEILGSKNFGKDKYLK